MKASEFKKLSTIQKIRTLSAIFTDDSEEMKSRLALINLITRVELGISEDDFLNEISDRMFGGETDD